ncbi:putative bifunctional diguanylate cyclase/phosphodiesterase [Pseudoalteromonas sp. SSM20]|uniref:putative bifunctional diguanylate cyclase/phosphodiesterase n=1 Tax=Pseudoalteromonas sp. SSM20 TaxID=3139394 RepID=UPI003BAA6AC4
MKNFSRFVVVTIGFIIAIYLILALSLTQGVALSHHKDSQINQVILDANKLEPQNATVMSSLFSYIDFVNSGDKIYIQVEKRDNKISAIPVKTLLTEMLLFSNFPLLFLLTLTLIIPLFVFNKKQKRLNKSITILNSKTDNLLSAFNLDLPKYETENNLARLNHSINSLSEAVERYKRDTETSIFQDKLTGLADRHAYLSHLKEQLAHAEKTDKKQALLFIDLDGFKQVNDSFGHSFGDEVLIQVAERLRTIVRNHSLSCQHPINGIEQNLSRLGGDEFSIFINDLIDPSLAVNVAQNVLHEIERDFVLGNKVVKIGASIGIAIYPDSASSPFALLQMADVAMYRAKTDGRGIFRVYSPEMGSKMRRYHYLLEEMRLALGSNNFTLSFQPIVHVDDCSIDYFECLVRWHHPVEGTITPTEFIPIAEESNLILELGDWILFEACRQMSAWYNAGMTRVRISVNISGVQLKHRNLHEWVMDTLTKVGLPPKALMLEITESCFIEASKNTIESLQKLRSEGITIAIDDFGTGFSSLCTLAELPVDVIKIDKLFIDQANDNPKYNKILHSISELGHQLNLKVVAEGVECAEQFELVRKMGIQCVQGYLVSKPETSNTVGTKVLRTNLNHIAATGTNIWLPENEPATRTKLHSV